MNEKFKRVKRITALILVIALIILIIATLIAAIFTTPESMLFIGLASSIVILPVIAYGYINLYKFITNYLIKDNSEDNMD